MYILIILISISVFSRKGGGGDTADGGGGGGFQDGGGAGVLQPYLSYKTRGAGQSGHTLHEGVRGTVRRQQGAAQHQVEIRQY